MSKYKKSTPPPSASPAPLLPLPRSFLFSLAKHDPTRRRTSQFKMMDRLMALEKPISEYFRQHPQNARKLTSHDEWTVANEVCSLVDDVPEATIRMQGAGDTHVSQAIFVMTEVSRYSKRNPTQSGCRTPPSCHPHRTASPRNRPR